MPPKPRSRKARIVALRRQLQAQGQEMAEIARRIARDEQVNLRAAWRLAHGLSQQEVADRYNAQFPAGSDAALITAKQVSYWENWPLSGREPSLTTLGRLARIYSCTITALIADQETPGATWKSGATGRLAASPEPPRLQEPANRSSATYDGTVDKLARVAELHPPGGPGPAPGTAFSARQLGAASVPMLNSSGSAPATLSWAAAHPSLSRQWGNSLPEEPAGDAPSGTATAVDIAMIRCALENLTTYERQFGGRNACAYAMDYVRRIVWPRLGATVGGAFFTDLCALAIEFSLRVASMQLDAGNAKASRDLLGTGLPLAQETGSPVMVAWVLARFSELDVRDRNTDRAIAYTSGAAAMASRSAPRARSFILAKHALALSSTGDRTAALRALGEAEDNAAKADGGGEPAWMRFYGIEHLHHDQARCLNNLGMGDQAIQAGEESMRARRLTRPRAFSLAAQAIGHIRSRDNAVDRACQLGADLVTISGQLASDRVTVELARVLKALRPYRTRAVRELAEAARPLLGGSRGS